MQRRFTPAARYAGRPYRRDEHSIRPAYDGRLHRPRGPWRHGRHPGFGLRVTAQALVRLNCLLGVTFLESVR
jgi:hypothetical protein